MGESADILVVTPHPDDAEFGVSGTVVHWVREGKSVVYVVCSSGEKGSADRNIRPEDLARTREEEQQEAAKFLGVREVVFLRYPDQALEDTPEFRKSIVRQIRKYRPYTVVASDPYRRYLWHRDHRISGQVTLDAIFPYARDHLAYPGLMNEGLEPHKVKEVLLWASENPNYRSDITDTFDIKLAALQCHKSQMGNWDEIKKRVRERAEMMAEGEKFKLAEDFYHVEVWR